MTSKSKLLLAASLLFALAGLSRAQYIMPNYYHLATSGKICSCNGQKGSYSGSVPSPTGWLTPGGSCSQEGVPCPWNSYGGGGSVYWSWTIPVPVDKCWDWIKVYASVNPPAQIPVCTNGQCASVVNPYNLMVWEHGPETDCGGPGGGGGS